MIRLTTVLLFMSMFLPIFGMNQHKETVDGLNSEMKISKLDSMLGYWKKKLTQKLCQDDKSKKLKRSFSELPRSRSTSPNKEVKNTKN